MATIHFRFVKFLEAIEFMMGLNDPHGPIFTRWLPDGQKDAFALPTGDPDAEISVWFERRGYAKDKEIIYDVQKKEIDPELLKLNSRLDGGPLFGCLTLKSVSVAEEQSLQAGKHDDPDLVKLGKRVLGLITPTIRKLVRVLKVKYGQYWLADVDDWDSRTNSLGSFCSSLQLRWSHDGTSNWTDFRPTANVTMLTGHFRTDYSFYLEEKDWPEVAAFCAKGYEPTTAGELLSHAHRLLDQGHLKYAIVEAVSALEVSLSEHIKTKYTGRIKDMLASDAKAGDTRRLPVRTALIAGMISGIDRADLESALRIIDVRNDIIHEGKNADPSLESHVKALLRVVAGVLQVGPFKFAMLNVGKSIGPP
jgi:hypothetical protein